MKYLHSTNIYKRWANKIIFTSNKYLYNILDIKNSAISQSNRLSISIEYSSGMIYPIVLDVMKDLFSKIDSEVERYKAPFKI